MPKVRNIPRHDPPSIGASDTPALAPPEAEALTQQVKPLQKAVAENQDRICKVEEKLKELSEDYVHKDIVQPLLDGFESRFQHVVKNRVEQLPLSDDVLDRLATVETQAAPLNGVLNQLQEVDEKIATVGMAVEVLKAELSLLKKSQELFAEALHEIRSTLGKVTIAAEAA